MTAIQATEVAELLAVFQGEIILPENDGYHAARKIWNGMFDRRPAIIARCISTSDVISAVNFARDQNLKIAVVGIFFRGSLL